MANGNGNGNSTAMVPAGPPLALIGSDAFRTELEPHTLEQAFRVCEMIASTHLFGVQTPEDAMVRLMTGRGLGLTAMQSLRGIYVVDGKPGIDASLMQGICMSAPICEEFVHVSSDEKHATYRAKRRGQDPKTLTFTIEDAQRAGLVDRGSDPKKNNYNKIPKQMCEARAKSALARLVFPDLLFGMYSKEELLDGVVVDMTPVPSMDGTPTYTAVSPVQSVKRDFAKEAEALKEQIAKASTKEERTAVRKAVAAFTEDAPPHYASAVKESYNASIAKKDAPSSPAHQQETSAAGGEGSR